jgi:hypothetical protein
MHDLLVAVIFVGMLFCPAIVASFQQRDHGSED